MIYSVIYIHIQHCELCCYIVYTMTLVGPFLFNEFASCNFDQVFAVIARGIHTDGAGKSPRFSMYSKASEFPMAQKKPVGVPGISFSYVYLMERNSFLDLFPLQRSCTHSFSPLLSASQICLYIALNQQSQQFPVWFCSWIVKKFLLWTGTGTNGKNCSSTAARTVSS